jgi:predicted DNA binding CopG/RHH family protein
MFFVTDNKNQSDFQANWHNQQKFKRNFLKNDFKIVVHISEAVNQKKMAASGIPSVTPLSDGKMVMNE